MANDIERFDLGYDSLHNRIDGDYVTYDDHMDALSAERDAARDAALMEAVAKCQATVEYRQKQIENGGEFYQNQRWIAGRIQAEICRDSIKALRTTNETNEKETT
jgi:hypothetical protein